MINENTFGKTPAAKYLARELSRVGNEVLSKSVGRRITSTNTAVKDLVNAYEEECISTKTLANTLRLMREEISYEFPFTLVDQLRQNVQIGLIKRGLRLCSVARKAERVMQNPEYRSAEKNVVCDGESVTIFYKFKDSTSGKMYDAGAVFEGDDRRYVSHYQQSDVDDITPELLNERSDRRCLRQGKPHMVSV